MSLRRRWKANAVELIVRNAVKTRDEGIYKCIVEGSLVNKTMIEFVTEPFLKLSTLKPVLRVFEKEETEIIIDFEALPFPRFYTVFNQNQSYSEILVEKDLVEMEPKQHQISPNQLRTKIHRNYGKHDPVVQILAKNLKSSKCITVSVIFEGKIDSSLPIFTAKLFPSARPSLEFSTDLSNQSRPTNWSGIDGLSRFQYFEGHEPDKVVWENSTKSEFHYSIEVISNPPASLVSWIFQPCAFNGCTPLNVLVSIDIQVYDL